MGASGHALGRIGVAAVALPPHQAKTGDSEVLTLDLHAIRNRKARLVTASGFEAEMPFTAEERLERQGQALQGGSDSFEGVGM
ncbi:hypothetical protein [Candidatus Synechococcus spongiarum]|uniref:hypothetical protein n=1 Tax=Candidatus Synechococcus spongiarum TaxID=431041 RepID=UPI0015D6675F|nr:hypothetical protein [Candidatus Synechococcus spongiarum]